MLPQRYVVVMSSRKGSHNRWCRSIQRSHESDHIRNSNILHFHVSRLPYPLSLLLLLPSSTFKESLFNLIGFKRPDWLQQSSCLTARRRTSCLSTASITSSFPAKISSRPATSIVESSPLNASTSTTTTRPIISYSPSWLSMRYGPYCTCAAKNAVALYSWMTRLLNSSSNSAMCRTKLRRKMVGIRSLGVWVQGRICRSGRLGSMPME